MVNKKGENYGTQAGVRLIWGPLNTGFTVISKTGEQARVRKL